MAVGRSVQYADIDELWLDPTNPRLGRRNTVAPLSQAKLLDLMGEWNIQELAVSFLESGFWSQEALIVVRERRDNRNRLVVVECNRRLAALKSLKASTEGLAASPFWRELTREVEIDQQLFSAIPYYLAESRKDVDAYLGFRHVTGIKQWDPAEKAEYIGRLVDDRGMSFDEVRRAIGSKTPTVRRNYIAFRMLVQFDSLETAVPVEQVESRFSVLYLALRETTVRNFLGIKEDADQLQLRKPVPPKKLADLEQFAIWLFGTRTKSPLFTDSRQVSDFARVLGSRDATAYLKTGRNPTLDQALRHSGLEKDDVTEHIKLATYEIELALSRVHLYTEDAGVQDAAQRFGSSAKELLKKFDIDPNY